MYKIHNANKVWRASFCTGGESIKSITTSSVDVLLMVELNKIKKKELKSLCKANIDIERGDE